jgi:hypothetical protein
MRNRSQGSHAANRGRFPGLWAVLKFSEVLYVALRLSQLQRFGSQPTKNEFLCNSRVFWQSLRSCKLL